MYLYVVYVEGRDFRGCENLIGSSNYQQDKIVRPWKKHEMMAWRTAACDTYAFPMFLLASPVYRVESSRWDCNWSVCVSTPRCSPRGERGHV